MSLRSKWEFEFASDVVSQAATDRAAYHGKREAYWAREVEKAKTAIEEGGINLRAHEVTGGQRHEVVIDPHLASRLSEAESKRQRHQRDEEEYLRWKRALSARTEPVLLDADDLEFFGLPASTP